MKIKKLCAGSIALALSIGTILPTVTPAVTSIAYAQPEDNAGAGTGTTRAGDTSQPANNDVGNQDETVAPSMDVDWNTVQTQTFEFKKQLLTTLVNEQKAVQKTVRYANANKQEQDDYNYAIDEARIALPNITEANINTFLEKALSAKKNLSGATYLFSEEREALGSVIAIANKLAKVDSLTDKQKTKVTEAITKVQAVMDDFSKSKEEINQATTDLSQSINDIVNESKVKPDDIALTSEEIKNVPINDGVSYGRVRRNLEALIIDSVNLVNEQINNRNVDQERNKLNDVTKTATSTFDDLSKTTSDLEKSYNDLYAQYGNLLTAINDKDTEASRLKANIKKKTDSIPQGYDKANRSAQLTYDIAKANANNLLAKPEAKEEDLKVALDNLRLAELTLAPVKTKTLDDQNNNQTNTQLTTQKSALNTLVTTTDVEYRKTTDYTNPIDAEKKAAYDKAIDDGKEVYKDQTANLEKVNAAIKAIEDAKTALKPATNNTPTTNQELENKRTELKGLLDADAAFKETDAYTKADVASKGAYDQAISKGTTTYGLENPKLADIESEINQIKAQRMAMMITNPSETHKDELKVELGRLVGNYSVVSASDNKYATADASSKTAYKAAVDNGQTILNKTGATAKEYSDEIKKISTAYANLKPATTDPAADKLAADIQTLGSMTGQNADIKNSPYYTRATDALRTQYDNAYATAATYVTKYADQTKANPTQEQVTAAIANLDKAIKDLNYVPRSVSKTALDTLVAADPSFRQEAKYTAKKTSSPQLVANYEALIARAKGLGENASQTTIMELTELINHHKNAINDAITTNELNARVLDIQDPAFKLTKEYIAAVSSTDPNVKAALTAYATNLNNIRTELAKANKDDVALGTYVTAVSNAINTINTAYTASQPTRVTVANLNNLIAQANRVMGHSKYLTDVAQQRRINLEQARNNGLTIAGQTNPSATDIENAVSGLEAALRPDDVQKLLVGNIDNLKDLVALVARITTHPLYNATVTDASKIALTNANRAAVEVTTKTNPTEAEIATAIDNINKALAPADVQRMISILNGTYNVSDYNTLDLAMLTALANAIKGHADYAYADATQKSLLDAAIILANGARTDADRTQARTSLVNAINQKDIKAIASKILNIGGQVRVYDLNAMNLNDLINLAYNVKIHADYAGVTAGEKLLVDGAITLANSAATDQMKAVAKTTLVQALNQTNIKPIVNKILDYSSLRDIKDLDLSSLVTIANNVKTHADYSRVTQGQKTVLDTALNLAASANTTETRDAAKNLMVVALNQTEIKPIVDKVRAITTSVDYSKLDFAILLSIANSVKAHGDYANVTSGQKSVLEAAITFANTANTDSLKETARGLLVTALTQSEIRPIADKVRAVTPLTDISKLDFASVLSIANNVKAHADYARVTEGQRTLLEAAITIANAATTDAAKETARISLVTALNQTEIKPIVDKVRNNLINQTPAKVSELKDLSLAELITVANSVKAHADYSGVSLTQRTNFESALTLANAARTDIEKETARIGLLNALNQSEITRIVAKVRAIPANVLTAINELLSDARKVQNHYDFKTLTEIEKRQLNEAVANLEAAVKRGIISEVETARTALDNALKTDKIKPIYDKVRSNNNTARDLLADAKKVQSHSDFRALTETEKRPLNDAITKLETAINKGVATEIEAARIELNNVLNSDKIKPIYEKVNSSLKTARELLDLAKGIQAHDDFKKMSDADRKEVDDAVRALELAMASGIMADIETARDKLNTVLTQSKYASVVDKVRAIKNTGKSQNLIELEQAIDTAKKVLAHDKYKDVDSKFKADFEAAIKAAEQAAASKDETKISIAKTALNKMFADSNIKAIVDEIIASDAVKLKADLQKLVNDDVNFKKTTKYMKAQKANRDAYDQAITEATEILKKDNPTATDLNAIKNKLNLAIEKLDGEQFATRLQALKQKFESEKASIQDATKREALETKIKALESPEATMDDLITVETELANTPKLTGTTTIPQTTPTTTTTTTTTQPVYTQTPVPTTTTTTTPVTTTSTLPQTVTPGSIVRTGIKGVAGVGVILAAAIGAFVVLGKNKEDKKKGVRNNEN